MNISNGIISYTHEGKDYTIPLSKVTGFAYEHKGNWGKLDLHSKEHDNAPCVVTWPQASESMGLLVKNIYMN